MSATAPDTLPSDTRSACFDITGQVLLPDGMPAEGATVYHYRGSASPLEAAGVRAKVVTNAEGAFALEGVAYDHMESLGDRIIAFLPGFGLAYWLADWEREDGRPVVLRLKDEDIVADGSSTTSTVQGQVVDGTGGAARGATVTMSFWGGDSRAAMAVGERRTKAWQFRSESHCSFITSTNGQGRFRFHRRLPYAKPIKVHARDRANECAAETTITLTSSTADTTLTLSKTATATGRILGPHAQPLPSVRVRIYPKGEIRSDYVVTRATVGEDGTYCASGLVAGAEGYVIASAPGYWDGMSDSIIFGSGTTTEMPDIVLAPADSSVAGKITDPDGTPLPGIQVCCARPDQWVLHRSSQTNAEGRYEVHGLPNDGELRVRAFSPLASNGCHFELPASPGATDVDFVVKPRRWRAWRRLLRMLRRP